MTTRLATAFGPAPRGEPGGIKAAPASTPGTTLLTRGLVRMLGQRQEVARDQPTARTEVSLLPGDTRRQAFLRQGETSANESTHTAAAGSTHTADGEEGLFGEVHTATPPTADGSGPPPLPFRTAPPTQATTSMKIEEFLHGYGTKEDSTTVQAVASAIRGLENDPTSGKKINDDEKSKIRTEITDKVSEYGTVTPDHTIKEALGKAHDFLHTSMDLKTREELAQATHAHIVAIIEKLNKAISQIKDLTTTHGDKTTELNEASDILRAEIDKLKGQLDYMFKLAMLLNVTLYAVSEIGKGRMDDLAKADQEANAETKRYDEMMVAALTPGTPEISVEPVSQ